MGGLGTGRGVLRRKPIERIEETEVTEGPQLARSLGLWQLTALGLGGIIGAGIFALAGAVAQGTAGPAVVVSFLVAGTASAAAALSYAEFAGLIPKAGSAYTYAYAVLGELVHVHAGRHARMVLDEPRRAVAEVVAKTHPTRHVPTRVTWIVGGVSAVIAGLLPIAAAAELTNIGILLAFVVVCVAVVVLRYRRPDLPRTFRTPGMPVVPAIGVVFSLWLITFLHWQTWVRFAVWFVIGLGVYFGYSYRRSELARR